MFGSFARTAIVVSRTVAPIARVNFTQTRLLGAKINGTCKWFDSKKGFGFIAPSSGEPDLFVHQSSIHADGFRSLADGEAVEFEVAEANGKTSAVNVTGPGGAFVQGAPYSPPTREPRQGGNSGGRGGGGGGGGRGGGGNFYNERY